MQRCRMSTPKKKFKTKSLCTVLKRVFTEGTLKDVSKKKALLFKETEVLNTLHANAERCACTPKLRKKTRQLHLSTALSN